MFGFSWMVEGELAGMGRPGIEFSPGADGGTSPEAWLEADLQGLAEAGVGALVSLTEAPLDGEAVRAFGLDLLHLPIRDMAAPGPEDVARFVAFVEGSLEAGRPVGVHCLVGRGRTGTMLACYLVKGGCGPGEAIFRVREARPGSIETAAQEDAVFDYARHLAEAGP